MYASFLGISEALHLSIFHQPLRCLFFDRHVGRLPALMSREVHYIGSEDCISKKRKLGRKAVLDALMMN